MPQKTAAVQRLPVDAQSKDAVRGELQLLKCAKRLEQFSTGRFRDAHGSSLSRFDVLANLARSPGGSLPTSALAAALISSQGNITRLLDRMEADGLIARGGHETDRRVNVVRLTAAGNRAFEDMADDHEHWMGEIFGVLGETETRQLIRLLSKIRARIDSMDAGT